MTKTELGAVRQLAGRLDEMKATIEELRADGADPETRWAYATKLAEALRRIRKAEVWIYRETVGDRVLREILLLRYCKAKKWEEIADALGGNNNTENVRQAGYRFIKRHFPPNN